MNSPLREDLSPSLAMLGIGTLEEAAYRELLRRPGSTVEALAESLGSDAGSVTAATQELARKGFVTHAPERVPRLFASPPDIAIESLLLQRQQELQLARLAIPALQRVGGAAPAGAPIVEVIDADPAAQWQPYEQSHRGAVKEVMVLVRPPFLVSAPDRLEIARAEARARGVRYRNIIHPDTLQLPGWPEALRRVSEAGEELRLLSQLPFKMIVADRGFGLLPLNIDEPEGPMLLLRGSAVLDALCELFETLWQRAAPLRFSPSGEMTLGTAADIEPDAMLPLLAAGMKDKKIAEQLGISERTLMRRIDGLYRSLDARSRFQAGWLAAWRAAGQPPPTSSPPLPP
ncbi:LuxR C-terminal-related transcriptional regulator [Ideonella azotifigens]|uniref:LuxR family transcriptional regulator n=1 Tax=Ideonella azotifigens TaxID=513160 RepID=A0ABP3VRS1_9BURK|nr:helix-turn-helix transcriptional regulator [Ideonella azotifigens]MCD2344521.1 LuxR C-terminal-related transcriptional regulator [Ideonella azotifigens]